MTPGNASPHANVSGYTFKRRSSIQLRDDFREFVDKQNEESKQGQHDADSMINIQIGKINEESSHKESHTKTMNDINALTPITKKEDS